MQCTKITARICFVAMMLAALRLSAEHLVPSDVANRLDEYELESIETYIGIALDTIPDLGKQPWYSSNDQATGDIKIIRSFEFDSKSCREIQIIIKTSTYTDQRTFSYCQENLQWQPLTYKWKSSE